MKRLILPALISLSALTSLVGKAPANAAINPNLEQDGITQLTTVETETTPQLESVQIDSEAEEVAYNYCYWETYADSSTYWVCW